jgi:uncharacterized repeat protein (TIGR01451 family)
LGPVAVNAGARITIVATIDAAVTTSVENTAEIGGNQIDPDQSNNVALQLTSVNQQGSLPLVKLDDPDPVTAGTNLTYTLYVSSTGPSDATSVVLTDTLPPEVSYVTSNFSRGICGHTAGKVTCLLGNMPVGSEATVEIIVAVDSTASGQINNTARVTADGAVPSQASQNSTVLGLADLALTNSASPNPVAAGESLTITIDVANNGPSAAKQVIVNSTLPAGTTFQQGVNCSRLGASVICQLGEIPNGDVRSVAFVVQVNPGTTGQVSTVSSAFSSTTDPDLNNNSADATAQVIAVSDLGIHKQSSAGEVVAGKKLTYTLTISNSGPSDAAGVEIADDLPGSVTLVSTGASQGGCNAADPVICDLGVVPLNGTAAVTVVVQIAPSASGLLVNDAAVTSASNDLNSANDSASVPVTVATLADLNVVKIDVSDPITAGLALGYQITVGNSGPSDARNVVLTDTLPAGTTAVSAVPSQGGPCDFGPPVTCSLGTITPGQLVTVDLTVDVPAAQSDSLLNNVVVSSDTPEANPADNSSDETTDIVTESDLALQLADAPDPVLIGDSLVYTLMIANDGPSDATSVVVTTTLAADLQLLDVSPAGACSGSAVVVCQFATLAAGADQTIVLTTVSDADLGGVITSTALVTADQVDPLPVDNSVSESTVVVQKIFRVHLPSIQNGYSYGEPNDICAEAFRILPNVDYLFMPNDVPDWYVFDLTYAGSMTVEMTNFTPVAGQLAASKGVDCSSRTSLGNVGDPGLTRTLTLGPQEPGRYYIFVGSDGTLSNTKPYKLRVSVVAPR